MGVSWTFLLSVLYRVLGTSSMKVSGGFTLGLPMLPMPGVYLASLSALAVVLKVIALTLAYLLVTIVGVVALREDASKGKLVSVFLTGSGLVGLHVLGARIL